MIYLVFKYDYEEEYLKFLTNDVDLACRKALEYQADNDCFLGIAIEVFKKGYVIYRSSIYHDQDQSLESLKEDILSRENILWNC